MNEVARRANIYVQPLANEVILYDKTSHQAHCVNQTVFYVWQAADGTKSVDQLAALLAANVDSACNQEVVLLALEDLRQANLLESASFTPEVALPSRRDVAKKLSIAGVSASLLPFIASMTAPTPAMARSGNYSAATFAQEYQQSMYEAQARGMELIANKNGSLRDLEIAIADGNDGIAQSASNQAKAQTDFAQAETEFNDMLRALGLPPL